MTIFDLACGLVLAVSILVGFVNGAVREIVGLFAFAIAAALAVLLLPLTGPLARAGIHAPAVVGNGAAVVTTFVVAYIALKISAHWLTMRLRDRAALGALDRVGGGVVGLVRALVLMGVFFLVYNAVTPAFLRPHWIEGGVLFPTARASGQALQAFAPKGLASAAHLGGGMRNAVSTGGDENGIELGGSGDNTADAPTQPPPTHARRHRSGYPRPARQSLDVLVERSR